MGSQITLTMSLIFIALFSVAIFGFALGFSEDNDAVMSISDDQDIDDFSKSSGESLKDFKDNSEGTYESILDTTVGVGSDVVRSTGPFAISVPDTVKIGTNIIKIPYKKIFGGGPEFGIFFTIFGGIVVILFGLYVYKTLRGNP